MSYVHILPFLPLNSPHLIPTCPPPKFISSLYFYCVDNTQVQLLLLLCGWVWGHPVQHGSLPLATPQKRVALSLQVAIICPRKLF